MVMEKPSSPARPDLIYIGDPMCSWCWGFAPVLDAIRTEFALPVEVIVGGLRPGPEARILDEAMRSFLHAEWTRIRELTGQPFDFAALDREVWTYDTELPAMAVATMRAIDASKTLDFFLRLQGAFYAGNIDVTDPDVYPALAAEFDLDGDSFAAQMLSEDAKAAAWSDFARSREMGIAGFPTLVLRSGSRSRLLTYGYRAADTLRPIVKSAMGAAD